MLISARVAPPIGGGEMSCRSLAVNLWQGLVDRILMVSLLVLGSVGWVSLMEKDGRVEAGFICSDPVI